MSGSAAFAPCLPPPCGTAVASVGTTDRLRNPAQKRCLRWRLLGRLLGAAPANARAVLTPQVREDRISREFCVWGPVLPVRSSAFTRVKTVRPVFETLRSRAMEPAAPEDRQRVCEKSVYRSMGILPMSRRAIPSASSGQALALPSHGRDARDTHGQDARATFQTPSQTRLKAELRTGLSTPLPGRPNPCLAPSHRVTAVAAVQGEFTALGLQHGTTRFLLPTCRWPQSGKLPPRPEAESLEDTDPSEPCSWCKADDRGSMEPDCRKRLALYGYQRGVGRDPGPVASAVSTWQPRGHLGCLPGCAAP